MSRRAIPFLLLPNFFNSHVHASLGRYLQNDLVAVTHSIPIFTKGK